MTMQSILVLEFPIEPLAIQSARFFRCGKGIRSYQPDRNLSYKQTLRVLARTQIPKEFHILNGAVRLEVDFIFSPPKSMRKKDLIRISNGEIVYKTTKPDLPDNLLKGTCDALTGIVWTDDSRICEVSSRKRYGNYSGIFMKITALE